MARRGGEGARQLARGLGVQGDLGRRLEEAGVELGRAHVGERDGDAMRGWR